jgi:aryl-alcohol dehydrogenase-like predicted oxidoreductase
LVKEGKIKYVGLSEVESETLEEAHEILGDTLIALQSEYSIVNPDRAERILPICRKLGVAVVPYSPLSRGMLTGKVHDAKVFAESTALDYRTILPQFHPDVLPNNLRLINELNQIARKKNCSTAQLALAWLLAQGDDIIPIPGTKRLEYLEENMGSLNVHLSSEDLGLIENARNENPIKGARYPESLMKLFHLKS